MKNSLLLFRETLSTRLTYFASSNNLRFLTINSRSAFSQIISLGILRIAGVFALISATLNVANHQGAVAFDLVSQTRRDFDIVLVPLEYGWSRSSFGVAFQSSFTFLKQVKWTKSILLKRWWNG